MQDLDKTKEQLIKEILELRSKTERLETQQVFREAEELLQMAEERFAKAFQFSADPLVITSFKEGRYIAVNDAWVEVTGWQRDEAVGQTVEQIDIWVIEEQKNLIRKLILENNGVRSIEIDFRMKSGEIRSALVSADIIGKSDNLHILWVFKDITDKKRMENALRLSEEKFSRAFHNNPDPISITTLGDVRYVEVNRAFENLTGYTREEVIGIEALNYAIWPDAKSRDRFVDLIRAQNHVTVDEEFIFRMKSGELRTFLCSTDIIHLGSEPHLLFVTKDITDRKRMEEALRSSEEKFSRAFNASPIPMSITTRGEGRFIAVNDRFCRLLGYEREAIIGQTSYRLGFWVDPENRVQVEWMLTRKEPVRDLEVYFKTRPGELRLGSYSAEEIEVEGVSCILTILNDITDRKAAEEEIKYLSFHDKLTGLYNRAYFETELRRLDTPRQLPLSLILGDVNGLKLINDVLGHQEGDKLLVEVASIMRQTCRKEDIVARWGGDEFIMLLPRCNAATAGMIFERLKNAAQHINNLPIETSLSVGLAIKNSPNQDIREIIKEAEDKMYRHKLLEDKSNRSSFLISLERTLWTRSHETREHCQRMQDMALQMGRAIKLSPSELDDLNLLAALHDIGKIAIPNSILEKPGKLNAEEWETIKKHPEIGYRIALSSPEMAPIAEGILHHHERWDGKGYPLGLKGEEIPLASRIIALVDACDVMLNGRPYQIASTREEVRLEIERCAGSQFEPELVAIFVGLFFKNGKELS